MGYKNYFSRQADDYARYRPRYPNALFEALVTLVSERKLAWDCATGNGQVALGLAPYFEHVYASDASEAQIARAFLHEKITYSVAAAESAPFQDGSIDLITVGQALHWFDLEKFYPIARRVLKPTGILAVWCYGSYEISDVAESVRTLLQDYSEAIEPFWPPEIQLVEQRYQTIPFPFEEVPISPFSFEASWDVDALLGYLRSWSATQLYAAQYGETYFQNFSARLAEAWQSPQTARPIRWPIYTRVGRP